jgi:hypothetical protein
VIFVTGEVDSATSRTMLPRYIHTFIHAYIHTYIHTYIDTYVHAAILTVCLIDLHMCGVSG